MNIKPIAILLAGALCPLLLAASCSIYDKLYPDLDRDVSGPATISSEWLEITPEEPLKPEREVQNVIIWFAAPHTTRSLPELALIYPDGAAVTPEMQLVDGDGNVFNLRTSGGSSTGFAYACCEGAYNRGLPKDRTYRSIRVRSDRPIQASKIVWRCYNPWDHK